MEAAPRRGPGARKYLLRAQAREAEAKMKKETSGKRAWPTLRRRRKGAHVWEHGSSSKEGLRDRGRPQPHGTARG